MNYPSKLLERWDQYWFRKADPTDLGFARFLFFSALFLFFVMEKSTDWSTLPHELWRPVSFYKFLNFSAPTPELMKIMIWVRNISLVGAALGLLTPLTTLVAAVSLSYILGLPLCYGYIVESSANVVLYCYVLVLSPCAKSFSLDNLIQKKFPHWAFWNRVDSRDWPVKLIWLIWCLMFFSAGLSKLRHTGLSWVTGSGLQNQFLFNQYLFQERGFDGLLKIRFWLTQSPTACKIIAGTTLFLELTCPAVLFSKRVRIIFLPIFFAMQVSMDLLFLVRFYFSFVAYIFFIPWGRIASRAREFLRR